MIINRFYKLFIALIVFANSKLILTMDPVQEPTAWEPIDVVGANRFEIDAPDSYWATGDPHRGWIDNKWNIYGTMRSKFEYRAPYLQNGRIVFVVIHGSLGLEPGSGHSNQSYYNPVNRQNQHFRHIMRFAASLGQLEGKAVDLLSYRWSGLINESHRRFAGVILTHYLESHYQRGDDIVILSHCHGGNVANICSQHISWPIKLLLQFACPVPTNNMPIPDVALATISFLASNPLRAPYTLSEDVCDAKPKNFESLFYYYSTSDAIATFGMLKKTDFIAKGLNTYAIEKSDNLTINKVMNIAANYTPIPAGILEHVKKGLTGITYCAEYPNVKMGLGLTLESLKKAYIHDIRNGKLVVGVRVQINGNDPGHSSIMDIVRELPAIYASLTQNYLMNYLSSSLFDLHVDMQQPNNIHAALRRKILADGIRINPLANALLQNYNYGQLVQRIRQEDDFSNQQAQAYQAIYHKPLNNVPKDQHKAISAIEDNCSVM